MHNIPFMHINAQKYGGGVGKNASVYSPVKRPYSAKKEKKKEKNDQVIFRDK